MATIIFKPTERCDANCIYCDVITKEDRAPDMSLELLETVFQRIAEYLEDAPPHEKVTLTWHGGEPTLLGAKYFRAAKKLHDKYFGKNSRRVVHIMQSNLTLLTQEIVDSLKDLGMNSIGTSFDPEPHVRGIGWLPDGKVNSELYNRRFFQGTRLLEKNKMHWGFIYVVNKKSLADPLGIFYRLTNMRLTGGIMLNPVFVYHEDSDKVKITAREYAEFLGEIFKVWWPHQNRYPEVQPFRNLMKVLVNYEPVRGCSDSGNCSHQYLYIGPDGKTSHCGRSGDWKIGTYGNIQDRTMKEIFTDSHRDFLKERVAFLKENDCKGCKYWNLCYGGCPLDAYQTNNGDYMHKTPWCEFKKVFIEEYFEPITGLKWDPKRFDAEIARREAERSRGRQPGDPPPKR